MNLWIFGDSYSCEWNIVTGERHKEYVKDYKPILHISNIIKKELNCDNVYNGARSGNCNYSILQSICECIDKIKKDDIVIIGWSEITRWRSLSFGEEWTVIGVNFNRRTEAFRKESVNRDCKRVVNEINSWIKLLNLTLPNQTIHWTPFQKLKNSHPKLNIHTPPFHMKRINELSNNPDTHITEEGHVDISKWLISMINKTKEYEKDKTAI